MHITHQIISYTLDISLFIGGSSWFACWGLDSLFRHFTPQKHNYIIVGNYLTVNGRKFLKNCFTTIFHNFSLFSSKKNVINRHLFKMMKISIAMFIISSDLHFDEKKNPNLCENRSTQINSNQFFISYILLTLIESQFVLFLSFQSNQFFVHPNQSIQQQNFELFCPRILKNAF